MPGCSRIGGACSRVDLHLNASAIRELMQINTSGLHRIIKT
jgi:hypothetical protein